MQQTISQVSQMFSVSTRTLRYYEELGLIHSRRIPGYAYRVYDEDTVQRLQQILFLRSVRIPLKSIGVLLSSHEAAQAIEVLRARMAELDGEIAALHTARRMLKCLEAMITGGSICWPELISALPASASFSVSKEEKNMSSVPTLTDVRILTLPKMTVAAAHYVGENPEDHADQMLRGFVTNSGLIHQKPDAHVYGFNHPNPSSNNPVYGYEFWVTIPENMPVPAPLQKKVMPGGLYAAHKIAAGDFHEWGWLVQWCEHNPDYAIRWANEGEAFMGGLLEEHLNYLLNWPEDGALRQIDLLLPIRSTK